MSDSIDLYFPVLSGKDKSENPGSPAPAPSKPIPEKVVNGTVSEASSKKKKKNKKKNGSKTEEVKSEKSSGKENGVVILENIKNIEGGCWLSGATPSTDSAQGRLTYTFLSPILQSTPPASAPPAPFKTDGSHKSLSYFTGLESDEIDLTKLKLPPGITITKVNQPVTGHGSGQLPSVVWNFYFTLGYGRSPSRLTTYYYYSSFTSYFLLFTYLVTCTHHSLSNICTY